MKKIKVVNNTITITSDLSLEEIAILMQYAPNALKITQKDKKDEEIEVFAISTAIAEPSINAFGITFTQETENHHATITALFPDFINTEEEKNQFLKNQFFEITKNLITIEKQAKKAIDTLEKELKTFSDIVEHINVDE